MKILVSGCTGFIGSNLVSRLQDLGHEVEGISRKPAAGLNYKVHAIDLCSNHISGKIGTTDYDAVIHLAASTVEKDLPYMIKENVITTTNILEYARQWNIKKFIFVSGHNVYSRSKTLPIKEGFSTLPSTSYGCTKLLSENLVSYYSSKFGMDAVILRVSVVYGRHQPEKNTVRKFIESYKNSRPISLHRYKNGFQQVDLINVLDVCDAIIRSLSSTNKFAVYNIASGKPVTVNDIIEILKKSLPPGSEITVNEMDRETTHFYYDINAARSELGFEPKVSLEEGIRGLISAVVCEKSR